MEWVSEFISLNDCYDFSLCQTRSERSFGQSSSQFSGRPASLPWKNAKKTQGIKIIFVLILSLMEHAAASCVRDSSSILRDRAVLSGGI